MSARIARDPSPFRSGLVHSALGALTLSAVLGFGGTFIHLTGNSDDASPMVRVALFNEAPSDAPQLNPRLPGYEEAVGFAQAERYSPPKTETGAQPDLGVDYAGASPASVMQEAATPEGIRINGRNVPLGQSYSQVATGAQPVIQMTASMVTNEAPTEAVETVPVIREGTPLARNARAFSNPDNKPTISIIVGGLGINKTRTRAAIKELPPEVTLSFAPTADNLRGYVREARRAGHEVLIELPMEPYDYGRHNPHPQVMQVSVDGDTNKARLGKLLAQTPGYVGVMNYQGAKFATDESAVRPVLSELASKGVAFFEDGSLVRSVFETAAKSERVAFGKSAAWIDARPEADEIGQQLIVLETRALESGSALGTGMSFPITLDLLKEWLPTLEDKGILLAPASHYAIQSLPSGQVKVAALDPQG